MASRKACRYVQTLVSGLFTLHQEFDPSGNMAKRLKRSEVMENCRYPLCPAGRWAGLDRTAVALRALRQAGLAGWRVPREHSSAMRCHGNYCKPLPILFVACLLAAHHDRVFDVKRELSRRRCSGDAGPMARPGCRSTESNSQCSNNRWQMGMRHSGDCAVSIAAGLVVFMVPEVKNPYRPTMVQAV